MMSENTITLKDVLQYITEKYGAVEEDYEEARESSSVEDASETIAIPSRRFNTGERPATLFRQLMVMLC
jgi:hypothetical protein